MELMNNHFESIKPMAYAALIIVIFVMVIAFLVWYVVSYLGYRKTDYAKSTHKPFIKMRFNAGDYGEYLCYRKLHAYEKSGAKFVYNCYLPRENNRTTEIDVMMIYTSGIYVLESKNYSGWIFGSVSSKNWTQTLPNGKKVRKEHFYNPVMQNATHIKWLQKIVGEDVPIHSIIVFSERSTLKKIDFKNTEAEIIKRDRLAKTVKKIDLSGDHKLSQDEVVRLYNLLYLYSQVDEAVKKKHIEDISK